MKLARSEMLWTTQHPCCCPQPCGQSPALIQSALSSGRGAEADQYPLQEDRTSTGAATLESPHWQAELAGGGQSREAP